MSISPENLQGQLEEFLLEQTYAGAILLLLRDDPADYIDVINYIQSTEDAIDMAVLHEDIGVLIRSGVVVYDVRADQGLYRLTTSGLALAQTIIELADEQMIVDGVTPIEYIQ